MKWQQDHIDNNAGNINIINIDNITIQFVAKKEKRKGYGLMRVFGRVSRFIGSVFGFINQSGGNQL
jgi:hypothetical protein